MSKCSIKSRGEYGTVFLLVLLTAVVLLVFSSGCLFGDSDPITDDAKQKGDPTICEQQTTDKAKQDCYNAVALAVTDPQKCALIKGDKARESCFYKFAQRGGDTTYCDMISDETEKSRCYLGIAQTGNDVSTCEKLSDSGSKNFCLERFAKYSNSTEACDKIVNDEETKTNCQVELGKTLRDSTQCDKVNNISIRDDCNTEVGVSKKDPDVCKKITDEKSRTFCIAANGKDASACNMTGDRTDECLTEVGINSINPEICAKLSADQLHGYQQKCYAGVAMNGGNELYCTKDISNTVSCIEDVAVAWKDPQKCRSMPYDTDGCVSKVAVAAKNISMCDGIKNEETKGFCQEQYTRAYPGLLDKVKFAAEDRANKVIGEKVEDAIVKAI
ncbi:Uncharacterised protein [uncultured archaeon]|nr:Uncharacterised protein [uncultured archaeon]